MVFSPNHRPIRALLNGHDRCPKPLPKLCKELGVRPD